GRPDIVLAKYRLAIFVHGCFWHRHGCLYTYTPKSRLEFWNKKFEENLTRDIRNQKSLQELGWRVVIVWECEISDQKTLERRLKPYFRKLTRPQVHNSATVLKKGMKQ